ncbi:MAG: hypothetical protein KCHDKBKB_02898 [Elusimicrobia bacterium]|nr:hypothetical protein [Elusimicrobiota bacterium]MCG3205413.1 hypothetical protein [Elusimicrobiota bacterium]MCG3205701.1 hypothetical protein [Elusimicrobiota bacterium]MCG3206021.1 hypothetical protein [Elusimicrobiota bacterium]MCG3206171.1 hypothetical protein [Elusimicrobiota bacterium]
MLEVSMVSRMIGKVTYGLIGGLRKPALYYMATGA